MTTATPGTLPHIKKGDILAVTLYVRATQGVRTSPDYDDQPFLRVEDLNEGIPGQFDLIGENFLAQVQSASAVVVHEKEARGKIVDKIIHSKGVFTVHWTEQDGKERTLTGKFHSGPDKNGYLLLEDLELPKGDRFRKMDTRTLDWMVENLTRWEAR